MNQVSPISFNANMIFVVVAVLIVLAMMMGGKNRTTHRTSFGWWIGLGVLLLIGSGFVFFVRTSTGPTIEVRHSGRSAFDSVKEQVRHGMETARESFDKSMGEVAKTFGASASSESKSKGRRKPSELTPAVAKPAVPSVSVSWTVEVKEDERKQKKEEVDKLLLLKATDSVNRWVTDRMPLRTLAPDLVTVPWLQERGAFPDPVEYQTMEVPRVNTSETDPLLGGTMKVVLTPAVQESLLDLGYEQLNVVLKSEQFKAQWIITTILLGITGFVAILGLVKTLVTRRMSMFPGQPAS